MPTRRWLAPAIGLSAVAVAVGTSTSAFAATAPHTAAHVHPHGDVMQSSGTNHLSAVSSAHHSGRVILHGSSSNWAGYAASGSTYTSVSASWTEPTVSCGSEDTEGWTETQDETSTSAENASAEVIAEAPSDENGEIPLSDFGTVDFTDATVDGSALGDSSPDELDMVDNGDTLATTSSLDSSGEDFSVTWDATS